MSQKIVFLARFQVFFKNKTKTMTCLMLYVTLHHWLEFQTNLTTFQWVISQKPVWSSLKLYLLLKTFEVSKLENYRSDINELGPDMYQLNTFNITKMRVSVNGRVRVGVQPWKLPQNAMKSRETWLSHLKPVKKMLKE